MTSKIPHLFRIILSNSSKNIQLCKESIIIRNQHVIPLSKRMNPRLYTTEAKSEQQAANKQNETATSSDEQKTELSEEYDKLKVEMSKITEQSKETEDKYKRALAETENVRQRMKKQVEDAKMFGIQGFCKDLLTVADTLSLAIENIPAEQLENPLVKGMHEGLKLTENQLLKVFSDHGVKVINPEGEKFDPNYHEALFQQPIPDKEAGTIFAVTKKGYTLNDRCLRPAMVGVVQKN